MQRRKVIGTLAVAVAAIGGVLMATTTAQADPAPAPRFVAGNVATCDAAGLTGTILFGTGSANPAAGSGTVHGAENELLDVTINAGFTASGIVVKGGPDANVYDGPFVGPITIEDMIAPPVGQDNTPAISHWFVCGGETPPGETSSPPVETSSPPGETSSPPVETSSPPGETSSPPGGGLPVTGASLGGLIAIGLGLIGGGAALLYARYRRDKLAT